VIGDGQKRACCIFLRTGWRRIGGSCYPSRSFSAGPNGPQKKCCCCAANPQGRIFIRRKWAGGELPRLFVKHKLFLWRTNANVSLMRRFYRNRKVTSTLHFFSVSCLTVMVVESSTGRWSIGQSHSRPRQNSGLSAGGRAGLAAVEG